MNPDLKSNLECRAKKTLAADKSTRSGHDSEHVRAAREPKDRLLSKHEVLAVTGVSYVTIWNWMRAGRFPRSRIVMGKSMWLASEVDAWLAGLPVRPLKGDDAPEVA
jgi:predicted DNA-binding transcriptional regulator AlpA